MFEGFAKQICGNAPSQFMIRSSEDPALRTSYAVSSSPCMLVEQIYGGALVPLTVQLLEGLAFRTSDTGPWLSKNLMQ